MGINTTLESASTTAASNGPSGSDQRTIADDALRQYLAFIKSLKTLATLASNTTVTPPSTANAFSVTGTTAITTIASTNSWDGRDILFIFAGILTFTHGSNLILPGSANITTAVGDAALMVQLASGQWRCVAYARADGSLVVGTQTLTALTLTGNLSVQGNTTLGNAGTDTIATTGNVTINAPTSGVALFVNSVTAGSVVGGPLQFPNNSIVSWQDSSAGTTNAGFIWLDGSNNLQLGAGNSARQQISSTGAITFNAPTSGTTVTAAQSRSSGANATAAIFSDNVTGSQTAGFGLQLRGTSNNGAVVSALGFESGGDGTNNQSQLGFYTQATSGTLTRYLVLTSDGRLFGTALHNNAGAVTGTTNQHIASGTFVPTLTGGVNVASTSSGSMNWIRVGNIVHFAGILTVDPTIASADTQVGISLPIASNLQTGANLSGTAVRDHQGGAGVYVTGVLTGDTTNDRANLRFVCDTNASVFIWYYTGNYEVL